MAGIYIHIPFCKSRCHYCDFYSTVKLTYIDDFVAALMTELRLRQNAWANKKIETIYFGGGTPSLLSGVQIKMILDNIAHFFDIDNDCEITLEANPENLTVKYLNQLKQTPINRISLGIQSFNDDVLKLLNRSHNASKAIYRIEQLQSSGLTNISVDLIYGIPGLSFLEWENTLFQFLNLKVPHLSAYHLTFEEKTVFGHLLKNNKINPVDESQSFAQYNLLCQMINAQGFEHYEISNFAKQGKFSRHNSNYWNSTPYLGLGPAAHSFDGHTRQWNEANVFKYINHLESGKLPSQEKEVLTPVDKFNDYIVTRLRTKDGINLDEIKRNFPQFFEITKQNIEHYRKMQALFTCDEKRCKLTEKGFFVSDSIMTDFIVLPKKSPKGL